MSSQTLTTLTDELRESYKSVLLNLSHNLTIKQQGELRFYCTELITEDDSGNLGIFRSLENAGKISWENVSFLKKGLLAMLREDLCKTLTLFEIKRDLIILLDLYARKKCGEDCGHAFHSVGKVADILVTLTNQIAGEHDETYDAGIAVESLVKSTKNLRKVLIAFEEVVVRELMDPWSRLTFLIVIAGEIVAVALAKNDNRYKTEALKLCCNGAEELSSRMINLGSWVSLYCYPLNHITFEQAINTSGNMIVKNTRVIFNRFPSITVF